MGVVTAERVEAHLQDAADTIRRMKLGKNSIPTMPMMQLEVAPEPDMAYGYNQERPRLGLPSGRAIDRMQKIQVWLFWLEDNERKIVFARSVMHYDAPNRHVYSWRKLEDMTGTSERTLRKRYDAGIDKICARLSREPQFLLVV